MSTKPFYCITKTINIILFSATLKSKEERVQENRFFQKVMNGFLYINLLG